MLPHVWRGTRTSRGRLKSTALLPCLSPCNAAWFEPPVNPSACVWSSITWRRFLAALRLPPPALKSTDCRQGLGSFTQEARTVHFERDKRRPPILPTTSTGFPSPVPSTVPELIRASKPVLVPRNPVEAYNPDHLLDPALLGKELCVRNWRPGDRFWPAHTKAPKKIKELLRTGQAGPERKLWPVVSAERGGLGPRISNAREVSSAEALKRRSSNSDSGGPLPGESENAKPWGAKC